MTLLSPSLARFDLPLKDTLQLTENLGCKSVHIDACHEFKLPNFFSLEEVRVAMDTRLHPAVTLHLFQLTSSAPPELEFLRPLDLAVLHILPQTNSALIEEFLGVVSKSHCRAGLALDLETPMERISPYLTVLDTAFIMAIPMATCGHEPNGQVLHRLQWLRTEIVANSATCKVGVDGGVNGRTFYNLVRLADELVIGGLLIHAENLAAQWNALQLAANGGQQ